MNMKHELCERKHDRTLEFQNRKDPFAIDRNLQHAGHIVDDNGFQSDRNVILFLVAHGVCDF